MRSGLPCRASSWPDAMATVHVASRGRAASRGRRPNWAPFCLRLQGRSPGRRLCRLSRPTPRRKRDVSLAFCWAHVRRRLYELAVGGASPIASEALQRIAALHRNENDIRGRGPEQRCDVRQARTRPLIADLQAVAAREARPHRARRANLPRRSAMRSRVGRALPDSSTPAASRSNSNTVRTLSIRPAGPQSQECTLRRLGRRRGRSSPR